MLKRRKLKICRARAGWRADAGQDNMSGKHDMESDKIEDLLLEQESYRIPIRYNDTNFIMLVTDPGQRCI